MTDTLIRIPTLTTDRLSLRAPRMDDLDAYAAFRAGPRSVGVGGPYPRSTSFQHLSGIIGHWQLRGFGRWMIADRETDAPLGICGPMYPEGWPEPEIAWSVFDDAEGRGIAAEAAFAARRYVYEGLGWTTVVSCIAPDNARSIALARRLGARHDGDFDHIEIGPLMIYRHPAPEALA